MIPGLSCLGQDDPQLVNMIREELQETRAHKYGENLHKEGKACVNISAVFFMCFLILVQCEGAFQHYPLVSLLHSVFFSQRLDCCQCA